jgi:uncharacterized protein YcfL
MALDRMHKSRTLDLDPKSLTRASWYDSLGLKIHPKMKTTQIGGIQCTNKMGEEKENKE